MPKTNAVMAEDFRDRDSLITEYQRYVHSVVGRLITTMGLPVAQFDEFVSSGYLGLVEAAERYDPSSGASFKNFAYLRIRGAIIDNIRSNSQLSGKAYRFARALQACQDVESEILALSEEEMSLAQALEYAARGALAFKLSLTEAESEVKTLVSLDPNPEEQMENDQDLVLFRKLVSELPEKERLILEGVYFDGKNFKDIVEENPDMTKSWVSRLHVRGLKHLKEKYIELIDRELARGDK